MTTILDLLVQCCMETFLLRKCLMINEIHGETDFDGLFVKTDLKNQKQNRTTSIHLHQLKDDGLRHAILHLTAIPHLVILTLMRAGCDLIQNQSTEKESITIQRAMTVRRAIMVLMSVISTHLPVNHNLPFLPHMKNGGLMKG